MTLNRKERRQLSIETVEILKKGFYVLDEVRVDLTVQMDKAIAETMEYTNQQSSPDFVRPDSLKTFIEVKNEGTLTAAARLSETGNVAVLNFASAKNPGGGFLGGSRAQEESLAMSSGLYPCLLGREMYEFHRPTSGGMYTPWVIYSPMVPVIRNEAGALLKKPYLASFLTSPAVNAGAVLKRDSSKTDEIQEQMSIRIDKVLSVAAHHGHDTLILGAWGCGVFRNDPVHIADLFGRALEEKFKGVFKTVAFAVLDTSTNHEFVRPFESRLA